MGTRREEGLRHGTSLGEGPYVKGAQQVPVAKLKHLSNQISKVVENLIQNT